MLLLLLLSLITTAYADSGNFGVGGAETFKTAVANVASLPTVGNTPSDTRIVMDTFDIYVWDGALWQLRSGSGGSGGITSINGLNGAAQTLVTGTAGTDFAISSAGAAHTFNLPTASSTKRGALSSADWTTFNNKEPAITATTSADYYRGDKTFQPLDAAVQSAVIVQTITNGDTTHASSSDALFDALALKQNLLVNSAGLASAISDETGTGVAVFSTDPVFSSHLNLPTATETNPTLKWDSDTGINSVSDGETSMANNNVVTQRWHPASVDILVPLTAPSLTLPSQASSTFFKAPVGGGAPSFQAIATGELTSSMIAFPFDVPQSGAESSLTFRSDSDTGLAFVSDGLFNSRNNNVTTMRWTPSQVESVVDFLAPNITATNQVNTDFLQVDTDANVDGDLTVNTINGAAYPPAISGSANTIATFDGTGALQSLPNWNVTTDNNFNLNDNTASTAGYTVLSANKTGNVSGGTTQGYNFYVNGNIEGYYGFNSNLQGTSNGQVEHITLNSSQATTGNYFMINGNMTGNITSGGIFGLNMAMSGTSDNFSPVNATNTGDTGYLNGFNLSNSGDVTTGFNVVNAVNSGAADYINGFAFTNSGDTTNGFTGINITNSGDNQYNTALNYSNTGTSASGSQIINISDSGNGTSTNAINVNMTGTYSTSVTGISVDVNSATSPGKTGIANQGALNSNAQVDTANGTPPPSFALNYLGGQFKISSGFPTTNEFGFGNNLATVAIFDDDMPADFTTLGLGYTHVGFVGSVTVASGKTVDSMNMALGGGGVPSGSGGTITNANMFSAAGFLNQGGTVAVTYMHGFDTKSPLCGMATNCWSFYDGAGAENYLSKLAIGTASKKVTSGKLLEVTGDSILDGDLDVTGVADLGNGSVAVTQAANDNSTKIATTAYVDAAVSGGGVVSSVFGRTGAVVAATSDYDAVQVDNTPAGNIAATDVQGAVNELDSEKEAVANKSTNTSLGTSNTLYPSQNAVKVYVDSAITPATVTISSNTTLAAPTRFYVVDTSGGAVTVTLPAAASNNGAYFTVKNATFGGSNNVTVARTGADLIEGGTSDTLTAGDARTYFSDGTNWLSAN